MRSDKNNLIVDLSFRFALEIIEFSELLEQNRKFIISRQLLKAGTSIGANIREAQNAESKDDFIHKFKVAAKEADECEYWLLLCKYSKGYPDTDLLLNKLLEIMKILSKIISTSKGKTE
ncbi:MAG: four helix bundle protein [Bacteroidales bacterium]|nr:four helix bundle protein [Bacteroidales bacterium]